ncbi:sensor histidine kinase [Actinomadura xylanilytica]|uniref:sensor histidine kinase n=1 Tax=Actinomadura xylanilytica TaxID=887459 RepID=UPI00255AD9DB|nr:histidine kinase [Actinomadura xylanilytica]MDL4770802.1 histidine kinase [Actinomadura xylanilytica]
MDEPGFETWRLRRAHLRAVDGAGAVALALLDVVVAGNMLKDRPGSTPALAASCATALVLAVIVAARRSGPGRALQSAVVVSVVAAAAGVVWDPFLALALTLYLVTVVRPAHRSARALGVCLAAATAAIWIGQIVHPRFGPLPAAGWTAAAWGSLAGSWVIGRQVRGRRCDAARLAAQRAHQIVVDERLRIARELHDVVTHGMGLIAVKAGVANHVAAVRPDEAREALRVIEATSRGALTEMRRLLDVLRRDTGHDGDLTPPGLAGLAELAGLASASGVRVELAVTGDHDLPEGLQLATYRIVQEALTNVVKHAAPTRCRATVRVTSDQVGIEVADDGPHHAPAPAPAPVDSGGHGLVGMRERVAMYGGRFTAGPRPEGGFAVAAVLPYGPVRPPGKDGL